jgi:hypothetical protein
MRKKKPKTLTLTRKRLQSSFPPELPFIAIFLRPPGAEIRSKFGSTKY